MKHRDSTNRNFFTVWKLFSSFCLRLDRKPVTWEDCLVLFVGYLVDSGKQSSTVQSYISAIKDVLRDDGFRINEDKYLLSSLTRACKLINDQIRTRLPIQKGMLGVILQRLTVMFQDQPYLATLYRTLVSTAYFSLFRVSELTQDTHPVLTKDVHVAKNKRKLLFILWTSKTHDKGSKPQMIKISSSSMHNKQNIGGKKNANQEVSLPCPYALL